MRGGRVGWWLRAAGNRAGRLRRIARWPLPGRVSVWRVGWFEWSDLVNGLVGHDVSPLRRGAHRRLRPGAGYLSPSFPPLAGPLGGVVRGVGPSRGWCPWLDDGRLAGRLGGSYTASTRRCVWPAGSCSVVLGVDETNKSSCGTSRAALRVRVASTLRSTRRGAGSTSRRKGEAESTVVRFVARAERRGLLSIATGTSSCLSRTKTFSRDFKDVCSWPVGPGQAPGLECLSVPQTCTVRGPSPSDRAGPPHQSHRLLGAEHPQGVRQHRA